MAQHGILAATYTHTHTHTHTHTDTLTHMLTMVSLRNDFCFWVKTVKGLILSSYMALYLEALGIESMLASTSTCLN